MPPLPGFSDNPFESRSDLVRAANAIIGALEPYKSKGKARIKIPVATAAGFEETAAQLEGFARPLWVVPFLLNDGVDGNVNLASWVHGLQPGTDPNSREYWGDLTDFDQRMVEMESIAVALLAAPDAFLGPMPASARRNLITWLWQINNHEMPRNNWLWFRVFVNLALTKSLGVPRDELQGQITADLDTLDTFQIGEGWSSDGVWGDERKQADYYSGSFAIQFAQLLYVRFNGDEDHARAEQYSRSARQFGSVFWRYFDANGAAIPFGRSMTYRFAFAAFWSAAACADVQLPEPLRNIGSVKGMLLRHLRWWSKCPDIFNVDGTMNIGFTYPNMYLAENYNSPQSVYWSLKSFIVLMLPEDHHFWRAPELLHPSLADPTATTLPPVQTVWPPRHILCNTSEHHFLLSSGQMTRKSHKAREAKYGKFAYSSAFAFSVPCGPLLEQIAPDSTLSVSHDDGETWKVRSEPFDERIVDIKISGRNTRVIPGISSVWCPWKYIDLTITTVLIPLVEEFPGWHVRVHRIKSKRAPEQFQWKRIELVDAGFALDAETCSAGLITQVQSVSGEVQGYSVNRSECLIKSHAGASGIVDFTGQSGISDQSIKADVQTRGFMMRADPNTNIIASRTFIPCIRNNIAVVEQEQADNMDVEYRLVSGIFAVSASAGLGQDAIDSMWLNRPQPSIRIVGDDVDITFE